MLTPIVEFMDERDVVPRPPVKKLIWNGTEFVPLNLYRMPSPSGSSLAWLRETYGLSGQYVAGCYWEHTRAGYTLMDEKVYMFYTMKWGAK